MFSELKMYQKWTRLSDNIVLFHTLHVAEFKRLLRGEEKVIAASDSQQSLTNQLLRAAKFYMEASYGEKKITSTQHYRFLGSDRHNFGWTNRTKIIATTHVSWAQNVHKMLLPRGSAPCRGSSQRSPGLVTGFGIRFAAGRESMKRERTEKGREKTRKEETCSDP